MRVGFTAVLLLAISGSAMPADPPAGIFVKALVAAINAGDLAQRKALLHPDTLRCSTPGKDLLLDEQFARQARFPIPASVTWRLTPAPPGQPLFADKFDYPVRPTHLLQLDYETGPNRSLGLILQLAQHRGEWREVAACPRPETVAAAKEASVARAKHQEKVDRLVRTLPAGLKAEVLAHLKNGRRIDAIRAYRAGSGEGLSTAKSVVDALEQSAER